MELSASEQIQTSPGGRAVYRVLAVCATLLFGLSVASRFYLPGSFPSVYSEILLVTEIVNFFAFMVSGVVLWFGVSQSWSSRIKQWERDLTESMRRMEVSASESKSADVETGGVELLNIQRWFERQRKQKVSVDVLVPCYKEELEIIEETISSCMRMHKPNNVTAINVYLCDDGASDERAALCAELGANYLRRPNKGEHGKAGNVNYGIANSSGDLIIILDADMAPEPFCVSVLVKKLLAAGPSVAMVQAPHRFRDLVKGDIYASRNLFFQMKVLPFYGRCGSCPFIGSNAIFRRSVLEEVGGIAYGSVTEDVCTSLKIHLKGYKTIYTSEDVAYGTSPQDGSQLFNQRMRWAWGGLQLLTSYFTQYYKLTAAQKYFYLSMALNNIISSPSLLLTFIALCLPLILGEELLPKSPLARFSFIYIAFERLAWLGGLMGRTCSDTMLIWSEDFVATQYYLIPCAVMLTYNFLKYVVTCGQGLKTFKSTAATKRRETEHVFLLLIIFVVGLMFLVAGGLGLYRGYTRRHYEDAPLALFMLARGIMVMFTLIALLRPPVVRRKVDRHKSSAAAMCTCYYMFMTLIPTLELIVFLACCVYALMDYLGVAPSLTFFG